MNKNVLCLIPIISLVAACGQGNKAVMPYDDIEFPSCVAFQIDDVCEDEADNRNPPVKIHITGGATPDMKVSPDKKVCPRKGQVVHFDITGPAAGPHKLEKGSVTIFPKKFGSSWLVGTNSADANVIDIVVPDFVEEGTDHDYLIVTASGLCVDPRVHVW